MKTIVALIITFLIICFSGNATVILFMDGDDFDGATNNTTVVVDGVTITVEDMSGNSLQTVGTGTTGLGIVDGVGNDNRFDDGEFFTLSFDQDINFQGFDTRYAAGAGESFLIQSDSFKNLMITPGTNTVTYDSGAGTFNFNTDIQDDYTWADISGGSDLIISTGNSITFTYNNTGSGDAHITGFTFTAVPEPSTLALIFLGGVLFMHRRLR